MERTFLKTALLLTPIFMPVILIGGIFGAKGAIIGIACASIACLLIVHNMDKIILRMYKAHAASSEDLSNTVDAILLLSKRAGVPMPSLYLTNLPLPGSFVIGKSPDHSALVIPERLLGLMKNDEMEAQLAHNIIQIDSALRLRTLTALIAGIFTMSANAVRWGAVFTGFGDYDDPAPKLFGLFVMGLVAPPAATMISIVAENKTDSKASRLCGNPGALVSAIERLENNNVTGYQSLGFICIVDPQRESFFEELFCSHPSKETRIKNIAAEGQSI